MLSLALFALAPLAFYHDVSDVRDIPIPHTHTHTVMKALHSDISLLFSYLLLTYLSIYYFPPSTSAEIFFT